MTALKDCLDQYTRGRCDFATFARHTAPHWQRLSESILRRWGTAPGSDREDLEQLMLLEAWQRIRTYNPARGVKLHRYVLFNAYDKAKKFHHRMRQAGGKTADRGISRLTLSSVDIDALSPSSEDARIALCELARKVEAGHHVALKALRDARGDWELACRALLSDTEISQMLNIRNASQARVRIHNALCA